jgi:hypothetical protein
MLSLEETNGLSNGHTNGVLHGNTTTRTPLRDGIYSPVMTFFDPVTEDVDLATCQKHVVRLAEAGLVGIIVMGSNGEAVHLTVEEKINITRATRQAPGRSWFPRCSGHCGCNGTISTRYSSPMQDIGRRWRRICPSGAPKLLPLCHG